MSKQPLPPCSCSWVPSSIAMATVLLQVLTQGNQRRAQTSAVWSQDPPRQLEQDSGHTSHAIICGLQGDGPNFKGWIREAHELREERVGAAKVLVATVRGRVVMVWGLGASCAAGIVVGVQVVQRQMLAAVAPSTHSKVVVVGCGSGTWVVFVDWSCPDPLGYHHSPYPGCTGMTQCYSAACSWGEVDELGFFWFKVYGDFSKGPGRHLGHFLDMAALLPPKVQELFNFP